MFNHQFHGKLGLKRRAAMAAAAVIAVTLLSACGTAPLGMVGTEQQLAPNRYMVRVAGSRAIAQNDVQRYLLRRAAQVTLQAGYTHFSMNNENIEARTSYIAGSDTYLHGPDYARRAGLWPEYPNWPETRFIASADITLLQANEAAGNAQAIEAQSVL
jgi:hypothetical protein